ncbi:hypothetical protein MHUMG1_07651 [Metarhizium humberi]|uniref:Zn(2)-C6 fungal-type domain-containing protein n=1 Tax=Metarhizium humberi TaxID=2596975 RepID=A0A9P8M780_9HYPO|nr:hypothetical protein MHUMG1_07651 [Metarhizium humberi]
MSTSSANLAGGRPALASASYFPQAEEIMLQPRRQPACVRCQQRKVKCDHKDPCATCVKAGVPCVASSQVRRRRKRRLPERDLLDRIRKYEHLLTQHNIKFEPLHPSVSVPKGSPDSHVEGPCESDDEPGTTTASSHAGTSSPRRRVREAKYTPPLFTNWIGSRRMLHTMNQEFRHGTDGDSSDDEVRGVVFKRAWDQEIADDAHLLFGFGWHQTTVDIHTLHPQPFQIFQLWQVYLDNVDPLLKMTHTHSLQKRLIAAAPHLMTITPELEALMFGIYCMAISSLTENGCRAMFAASKVDLLSRFQLGCQQALLNSRFMRSTNRDCLTALCLYLISVRPTTAPQSLSSILGTAIRIAQRMGLHSEATLAKASPLEAEMGRRLWWSLILFDTRIGEMADLHATALLPTWDCRVPLTINDSDIREEMKEAPQVQGKLTDVIFAVCRSELADFVRYTKFHLGFFGPGLRASATTGQEGPEGSEIDAFDTMMEEKYLRYCDPENAIHFMTIWTTRGNIAKYRLVEHHFRYSGSSLHHAETQRDAALSYALRMLECNTKLMTSPLTKGFIWMVHCYFPFIAYIQIIQHLKWRPMSAQATDAWKIMNDNYHALLEVLSVTDSFFRLLTNMILQAWEARESAYEQSGYPLETPPLVSSIRQGREILIPEECCNGIRQSGSAPEIGSCDVPAYYDIDMDHLDWSAMDWDLGYKEAKAPEHEEQQLTNTL